MFELKISAIPYNIKAGIKMTRDGPLEDIFSDSMEPLLDFTGDREKVREFLSSLELRGDIQDLAGEDLSRLSTALVLKLLMQGSVAVDSIIGEVIRLKREVVENAFELVQLLNACGNRDLPGLGLALCLRDKSHLAEARNLANEYKKHILREIKILQKEHKDMENIRYLLMENMESGAVICGLGIRYLYTDRPLLTLNRKNEEVKISARGNKLLVANGLDLSLALRKAAEAVGGVGGGHNIASGASIPQGTEDKFLAIVDDSVGEQLQGQGRL